MINTVALTIPEKRIVFENLNWQKYQTILEALGENHLARIIDEIEAEKKLRADLKAL